MSKLTQLEKRVQDLQAERDKLRQALDQLAQENRQLLIECAKLRKPSSHTMWDEPEVASAKNA